MVGLFFRDVNSVIPIDVVSLISLIIFHYNQETINGLLLQPILQQKGETPRPVHNTLFQTKNDKTSSISILVRVPAKQLSMIAQGYAR